jgi:predicted acyl esterase
LLLVPDDIYELTLDQLMLAATFKAGHRIRLQVAASFAPHLSGNLQTGASEAYSDESRAAEITLYHSVSYPTVLELPVIE